MAAYSRQWLLRNVYCNIAAAPSFSITIRISKAKSIIPDLPVTADSILVLRSAGPLGAPGFPEWGMLPIPKKLLVQSVRDMVRISDARMSGTSYGILHSSRITRISSWRPTCIGSNGR